MREYPMPFAGTMAYALFRDPNPKTQTRRVITQVCENHGFFGIENGAALFKGWGNIPVKVPYEVGDRMWVQEPWGVGCRPDPSQGWRDGIEYEADEKWVDEQEDLPLYSEIVPDDFDLEEINQEFHDKGWIDPKLMPRWASRTTLEVTGVRVERLRDISEEDAKAEGCDIQCSHRVRWTTYQDSFHFLWDSLAKPGKKWADNPWVWVVEFRRVEE